MEITFMNDGNDGNHKKSVAPVAQDAKPVTLSDSEISTERNVSRRSLLGALGIGTGVFAAAIFGGTKSAEARRVCDSNASDRCFDVTDRDPYDAGGDPYDRR
jgi:hypothetical protein